MAGNRRRAAPTQAPAEEPEHLSPARAGMGDSPENEPQRISEPSALEAIERASVDMQVSTAKTYPRSITRFMDRAKQMIRENKEVAASCFYALKRHDNRSGEDKFIEGPSVRLSEIAASCFQNLRIGSRPVKDDGKFVTAQGICFDLENNVAVTQEVQRRVTNREGYRFSDDMIAVTTNAACAIARRNAVVSVLPRAYINQLFLFAKEVAVGHQKSLAESRQTAIAFFVEKFGLQRQQIFDWLEVGGMEEVGQKELGRLAGLKTALQDRETTLDKEFKPPTQAPRAAADVKKGQSSAGEDGRKNAPPAETKSTGPDPDDDKHRKTPQGILVRLVRSSDITVEKFELWLRDNKTIKAKESWADVPSDTAGALAEDPRELVKQIRRDLQRIEDEDILANG